MKAEAIGQTLLELCSVPSITESEGEVRMADKVCQLLREIDYFKQNPQLVQKCTIESDEFGRALVCLVSPR